MKVVLLRVGIDTGSGGIHGPLFQDGTFEYIPMQDEFGVDSRTYGNVTGRYGKKLVEFFPKSKQEKIEQGGQLIDVQPASPPRTTTILLHPARRSKLATIVDRTPVPQNTYTVRSVGTSSIRLGNSLIWMWSAPGISFAATSSALRTSKIWISWPSSRS